MAKIVFYCRIKKELLETVEFYKQDIETLKTLGHEVLICTHYREIPIRFDVIFIWWWTYAAWPIMFAKLLGKPSIVTGTFNFRFPKHFAGRDYFGRPLLQRLLIRLAVKMATINVFVSKQEYDACTNYFNLSNSKFCYHILDSTYLRGPAQEREVSILNVSWSGKQNLIRKGIPELLKAIKILREDGLMDTKVYLAGHKGDGYEFLKKEIINLDIKDNVELLGEITKKEKINYLRRCEIYVQPSHYEGFGLAIAEAMGSGACVITCKVGAVEEVVGNAGIYVNPGSAKELAEALKEIINNDALRKNYQKLAFVRAKSLFAQENKIKFMHDILKLLNIY